NNATLTLSSNMVLTWQSGTINSGSSLTVLGGSTLNWLSGTVAAGGVLTAASNAVVQWGSGEIDGLVAVAAGATLELTNNTYYYFSGGTLTNNGTVNWKTGTLYGYSGSVIGNHGLLDAQADNSAVLASGTAVLLNTGTFRKSGGGAATSFGWAITNNGLLKAQTGTISLASSYDLSGGTIDFSVRSLYDFGKVLLSGSTAILAGSVTATPMNGYSPMAGDSFGVLTYSAETGTFTLPVTPALALGGNYGATLFTLIVSNATPTLAQIPNQVVDELATLVITNAATDAEITRQQITGISIPTNSMDATCYPLNDGAWTVQVPPYPLTNFGIGHLIDPAPIVVGAFTLHDHVYTDSYVPDPTRAVVTYTFTNPVVVQDVDVIEHANGITRIEGFVGDSEDALVSIGAVFGPAGDTTTPFSEGQAYTFHFTNNTAGKVFRFVIRKTVINNGYALYRAYPSAGSGNHFASAVDPAGAISYTLLAGPTNASISTAGVITWTPNEAQGPGTNTFTTVATDNGSPALSATNTFTVVVNEVNSAPILPVQTNVFINELTTLIVTNTATDTDIPANTLTYALLAAPGAASISTNGVITWATTESDGPSTNTFTTKVTDNGTPPLSATNTFTVVVNEVNSAPVVGLLDNYAVNPGQVISFTATATDSDIPTNTLTFSLVNPPAGAAISGGGAFNWRPTTAQANSTNSVKVKVTDNGTPPLSGTNSFNVVVHPLASTTLASAGYSDGHFTMNVSGTMGPDYVISASTNLVLWTDIFTNLSPATPFPFTDTNGSSLQERFYRVRLSP
ncbi:MAG TPA: hypothetical protein VF988_11025, partial [Verrucomicrobiae bacterium]